MKRRWIFLWGLVGLYLCLVNTAPAQDVSDLMVGLWTHPTCRTASTSLAQDVSDLRLVPFPKQVEMGEGQFALDRSLRLEAPREIAESVGTLVTGEIQRAGFQPPKIVSLDSDQKTIRLLADGTDPVPQISLRDDATDEDYAVRIEPDAVTIRANATPGLLHGVATLSQLIRANRRDASLPSLTIHDWPSIRWRAFQDDITRGPSTKLCQLRRDVARGASLKLNIFTYYMQHQFAFTKHPLIGPEDGSLTPKELASLVEFARPLGIHIMGNQQSFAHMQHTLAHEEYAHLREDDRTLSPAKEETYQLLDDLYSDVLPVLDFGFFNVCCDETWGLGIEGPSKSLADELGPGGVYVRHILRVRDLVRGKYGKRMMMWGDIILKHPDKLDQIPDDVIMLTWGYDARDSFEDQIIPFGKTGYDFFVCPGVNNWSRVLPDFGRTVTNIHNFVRDGSKHGASGVLVTSWDDDGENLNAPNWYGFAWGAECAWNASQTSLQDFNRRVGAVLFGESDDHFGRAVELLSDPRFCGLGNRSFWDDNFRPLRRAEGGPAAEQLSIVRQAIEHLDACKRDAVVDADLLDSLLFGARRLELYFQRVVDRLAATDAYDRASVAESEETALGIKQAEDTLRRNRAAYADLRGQWQKLWLTENKPHALDLSLARYDATIQRYDGLLAQLAGARQAAAAGRPLPAAADVGLAVWSKPESLVRPAQVDSSLGHYQDYFHEFAFDGNPDTFFWSDRGLKPGDHFTLSFDQPTRFDSLTLLMGTQRYRNEYVHDGVIETSPDGKQWTELAKLNSDRAEVEMPASPIKSIRLRSLQAQRFWLIIREMVLVP
jgi:hypothetical protein